MPKQKTHKGLAKRCKLSGKGKVRLGQSGKSHLMAGTRGKNVRKLKGNKTASTPEQKRLSKMLKQG